MDWDKAYKWVEEANKEKGIREIEPVWSWDCGLKLDYDGGLLRISSRFYQVNNDIFDGSVSFLIGDEEIFTREFSGRHIDVLKNYVEKYTDEVKNNIERILNKNLSVFTVKSGF